MAISKRKRLADQRETLQASLTEHLEAVDSLKNRINELDLMIGTDEEMILQFEYLIKKNEQAKGVFSNMSWSTQDELNHRKTIALYQRFITYLRSRTNGE